MSLSALQLDAFYAVVRAQSFGRAAKALHLTQPALSMRIKALEEELGQRLFLRSARGIGLTDAGTRLLRYAQARETLERELVSDLTAPPGEGLGGTLRIAGFSSVVRSLVVPALAPVARAHRRLRLEIASREMDELTGLLDRAGADFVLLDRALERVGLEHVRLGVERLVLVESTVHPTPQDIFLDHDASDTTTQRFLRRNGQSTSRLTRWYLDDIYGLLDGAAQGLGRAVVSRHLLRGKRRLREVPGLQSITSPVVLHYWRQPSYPRAHQAILDALLREVPRRLREQHGSRTKQSRG
ncbi:LysR family transcriptional regulator [Pendulispora rubella]|uniref:LysR family transcriptional regulator n=1 Tax=Pendulispora rubella TaxID=2741070 RepID=A0ABZ2LFR3_9BACT